MNFEGIRLDKLFMIFINFAFFFILDYRKANEYKRCAHECEKGKICDNWTCDYFYKVMGLY